MLYSVQYTPYSRSSCKRLSLFAKVLWSVNLQHVADRNVDKRYCLRKLDRKSVQNLARRQYLYDMFGCLPLLRLWIECIIVRPCTGAIQALTFSLYILKAGPNSTTSFNSLSLLSLVLPLFGADCSGPLGAGKLYTRLSFSYLLLAFTYTSAGVLEQSMGARNRVGIGLSYRPARQHRLVESIPGLL
jgi:hypothetical protein